MPVITQSTSIKCQPKELFQFLTKPANIISVSPTLPSLSFHSPNLLLGKGQIIHFSLSYGLFRLSWSSKISKYEPYSLIEDTLQQGPFKKWVHRLTFNSCGTHTVINNTIDFAVGMGPLGKIMEKLVVKYQVETYMKERMKKTTEKLTLIKKNEKLA